MDVLKLVGLVSRLKVLQTAIEIIGDALQLAKNGAHVLIYELVQPYSLVFLGSLNLRLDNILQGLAFVHLGDQLVRLSKEFWVLTVLLKESRDKLWLKTSRFHIEALHIDVFCGPGDQSVDLILAV